MVLGLGMGEISPANLQEQIKWQMAGVYTRLGLGVRTRTGGFSENSDTRLVFRTPLRLSPVLWTWGHDDSPHVRMLFHRTPLNIPTLDRRARRLSFGLGVA